MHLQALLDDIFTGTATLHLVANEKGRSILESTAVAVRIRPLEMAIEIALPDDSAVSETLIHFRYPLSGLSPEDLYLTNLKVQHVSGAQLHCERMDALTCSAFEPTEDTHDCDQEDQMPKSPIHDWLRTQSAPASRLQLTPASGRMQWLLVQPFAEARPGWLVQYDKALPKFHIPCHLRTQTLPPGIQVNATTDGTLSVSGPTEGASNESVIELAMELLQGGALTKLYSIQDDQLTLYRTSLKQPLPQLALLSLPENHYSLALNKMVKSLSLLGHEEFKQLRTACLYYLEAKIHRHHFEIRYLTAMIFVETMDQSKTLSHANTQQLLGVDFTLAKVFNCIRHMLSHGRGDIHKAYGLVIEEKLSGNAPDLKNLLQARGDDLDWRALIFFRLLERIDAYIWMRLIGKNQQNIQRKQPYFLGQMSLPEPYFPEIAKRGKNAQSNSGKMKKSLKEERRIEEKRKLQISLGKATKELTHLKPKAAMLESENEKFRQLLRTHNIAFP